MPVGGQHEELREPPEEGLADSELVYLPHLARSESGVETCLQGTALLLVFEVGIVSSDPWRLLVRLKPA